MPAETIIYYITAGAYYIAIFIAAVFSIFSVYILIRYGKNMLLSLMVSVLYAVIFLGLLQQSLNTLHGLANL